MIEIVPKPNGGGFLPVMVCDHCRLQITDAHTSRVLVARDRLTALCEGALIFHRQCAPHYMAPFEGETTFEFFQLADLFVAPGSAPVGNVALPRPTLDAHEPRVAPNPKSN